MNKLLGITAVGAVAFTMGTAVQATAATTHLRGTVSSVNGNSLAIKTYEGKTIDLNLSAKTMYAWVVPSSLSAIKKGDFIGTATQGATGHMVAQEVVIFPESMRGAGEGSYPWSMSAAVAAADAGHGGSAGQTAATGPNVQGTMTNGTVTAMSGNGNAGSMVKGTMTNGTVAKASGASGAEKLSIKYKGGEKEVAVPADVPIVKFAPGSKTELKSGEKAFIVAARSGNSGKWTARFVAVGKNGLMPPM